MSKESTETETEKLKSPDTQEDYGFFFFPHRKPGEGRVKEHTFTDLMKKGMRVNDHIRCKLNVIQCYHRDPIVKLMMRALKTHGCPVNPERHFSCEPCRFNVSGGFDHTANQVVVCEEVGRNKIPACSVMGHELLHAFDKCRAKLDFTNPRHVACTEIRAANLLHCSFQSAWWYKDLTLMDYKLAHQTCVKRKALASMLGVLSLSKEEGEKIIDEVFIRCYNDFEPVGRRIRPGTRDKERALTEGVMYGYDEDPE